MDRRIILKLKKRKEQRFDFYYKIYGQIIKKKRLEKKLTQEYVAKAICSNTYISKAENSQVIIGDDQLYQIMEKLDISSTEFAKPETLVYLLDKVIDLFYYKDIDGYKQLIEKVKGYQFHVVIEIIKLGYYTLIKDYKQAKTISDQLMDYLNSMDDLAFTIFLIFSSLAHINTNRIKLAKYLIDSVFLISLEYVNLSNLRLMVQYIAYGKSHKLVRAQAMYGELVLKLTDSCNYLRIKEIMGWNALFSEYNKESLEIDNLKGFIEELDSNIADEFLLVRSINLSTPFAYLDLFKNKENEKYLTYLYFCAKEAMANKNYDLSKGFKQEISELHYKIDSQVDYNNLLNLENNNNVSFHKEYLINPCLKIAQKNENIYFANIIIEKIVELLKVNKRYKDALNYKEKLHCSIS